MKTAEPPRVAAWLLQRFDVDESIVGDLIERYRQRRSAVWYWRQVLLAISAGAVRQIHHQKLLTVRAVGTGFAVLVLFDVSARWWLSNISFHGALWMNGHLIQPGPWLLSMPLWIMSLPIGGAMSGWIVGRLFRAHRASMVLVFAGCFVIWQVVQAGLWTTIASPPNGFRLGTYALFSFMWATGIVLGGLWSTQDRSIVSDG